MPTIKKTYISLVMLIEINIIRYIELMPLILKIAEILFLYQTNIIRFDWYILVILFTDTDTIKYPTFFFKYQLMKSRRQK